ncbi:MAG: ATP-binding protein, partial [Pseudomonadota bacterium]
KLVLKEVEHGSQTEEDMRIIEKHAMNCKKIVEDLLKFSRSTETTKTASDLNELINEVVSVVESKFKLENVRIDVTYAPDLPVMTVDADKMKQVFMNLVMNARQAMDHSGSIQIATALSLGGENMIISFKDNGCGIPGSIIHKIFDPFFTTKPTGMGTGLGLSVSYGIIKDHEGGYPGGKRSRKGFPFQDLASNRRGRYALRIERRHEPKTETFDCRRRTGYGLTPEKDTRS